VLARLDHIQLMSEAPDTLAAFYQKVMGMQTHRVNQDLWLCQGPERSLLIGHGRSKTLKFGAYRCEKENDLMALRARLEERGVPLLCSPSPLFTADAFSFLDPDGNQLVFGLSEQGTYSNSKSSLPGRLQHLVVASDNAESLVRFYTDVVNLIVTDTMLDHGAVAACWMRTDMDSEHHSFAIFRAPEKKLDHYSFEVGDWARIRDWADSFAEEGIKLSWGPGRHGPGNNLFIFIHDPDGNWIELSAELEVVGRERLSGVWLNEPETLNRWGHAFMRS